METLTTDIAVIGLGAMGSATLYQLARQGMDAIGIDRFAPPHERGSSHGETRITRQAVGEGAAYVPLVKASHRIWRELEAASGETLLEACGALIIAPAYGESSHHGKADFFETTVATAAQFDIAHECLTRDQVAERFPAFTGMGTHEAAYFEQGGGYLHPERCIRVQLEQAERLGARVMTGQRVTGIDSNAEGVEIVIEGELRVQARRVVIAAGAWAGELLGAPFNRLLTVRRQVLHWFQLDTLDAYTYPTPICIWMHGSGDSDYFYAFPPLPDNTTLKVASEQYRTTTRADALEREVAQEESTAMYRDHIAGRIHGASPHVDDAKACLYTLTPDLGFILDEHPSMPGVFVIAACSGHGFKHSAGIGQAVAEHVTSMPSDFDLTPFSLARFGY